MCSVWGQCSRRRQWLYCHGAGVSRGVLHLYHLSCASERSALLCTRQEELLRELLHSEFCLSSLGFCLLFCFFLSTYKLLSFVLPLCSQSTLERCSKCSEPILDRILRAMGKAYHPHCFTCVVCGCCLDGVPFTVDATSQIHCIEDFHRYSTTSFFSFSVWFEVSVSIDKQSDADNGIACCFSPTLNLCFLNRHEAPPNV